MSLLPDPPDSLAPAPRQFYEELRKMLDVVRPARLDFPRAVVKFTRGGVDVDLPHITHSDWGVGAMVGPKSAIVGVGAAHEHFDDDNENRPWPVEAVDFVAELLRGEVEIEIEYRGDAQIKVRHYLLDRDGQRRELGMTGLLRPALLMFWKPTRTEVTRVDFGAEG